MDTGSTRSLIIARAKKIGISGDDQWAYLRTRESTRSVPSASRFHHASVGVASLDGRDLSRFWDRGAPRLTDFHLTNDAGFIASA